ncbi:MAG: carboxylating nicotinate-nucleotide diphosphorylase [Chitinophagaceae bacterium]|nr:carboxylating nicotinate-nucleotide diphosphorylase [Chitinophagaceae bacterium]
MNFDDFIQAALDEDIKDGDHSTLCCIPPETKGTAILKVKENGILAGVAVAQRILQLVEPQASITIYLEDGCVVQKGDLAFEIKASVHTILKTERLILNIMQRMSGIATLTRAYVNKLSGYAATLLDTRKTTPNFRWFEKEAVRIGGGQNHRMGLYDMIMLKDNHIDFCGGIEKAIDAANNYLKLTKKNLAIEVETRSIDDVKRVVAHGGVQRIMFDNFSVDLMKEAVLLVPGHIETEASGGITLDSISSYAATGVQFISAGAIIHHAVSMDLSLKAVISA